MQSPQEEAGRINLRKATYSITFPPEKGMMSKRGILAEVGKIYDSLGLAPPETLSLPRRL